MPPQAEFAALSPPLNRPPDDLDHAPVDHYSTRCRHPIDRAEWSRGHTGRRRPRQPLVPANHFDYQLIRGMSDDEAASDDMRISGQRVKTTHGAYTVIVGGGSEAVEAIARTVALLLACGAPIIVGVAAAASYRLVRQSLQSVDAIRSRVAEISASDLAERVPVPSSSDEISALAVTMNEMLTRIEAGHRAQQRFVGDASHELRSPLTTIISGLEAAEDHPEILNTGSGKQHPAPRGAPHANADRGLASAGASR